jgi:thiol-disulfide isomerase/thioredoxin/outer membrane lipoprotein-sorting protein
MIIMKQALACILLLIVHTAYSQNAKEGNEAVRILKKVDEKLNSFSSVSYRYSREMRYYAANYHNKGDAAMYIEYITNSPTGFRFQAEEEKSLFVYDGAMTLRVDKKEMTIDSASAKTVARMESNSHLYHSLAMLKNILPLVISNDTIHKSVRDTTVDGRELLCVKIERPGMYFQLFKGVVFVKVSDLQRPYYLLVDKNTYLPYQFISKYIRGNDDRDFVTVTYKDINTHPKAPASSSWNYATYAARYKPYTPVEKKPLVKAGAVVADFILPNYTPGKTDSTALHEYAGKVVLLEFWFKSCGPCMEAMPHYNALQNKFGKDKFQLLTINIEDGPDDIKFFYNKHQPVYKMLYSGDKVFENLGLSGCPSAVLLGKDGKVAAVFEGFDQAAVEKKIGEALSQ